LWPFTSIYEVFGLAAMGIVSRRVLAVGVTGKPVLRIRPVADGPDADILKGD